MSVPGPLLGMPLVSRKPQSFGSTDWAAPFLRPSVRRPVPQTRTLAAPLTHEGPLFLSFSALVRFGPPSTKRTAGGHLSGPTAYPDVPQVLRVLCPSGLRRSRRRTFPSVPPQPPHVAIRIGLLSPRMLTLPSEKASCASPLLSTLATTSGRIGFLSSGLLVRLRLLPTFSSGAV